MQLLLIGHFSQGNEMPVTRAELDAMPHALRLLADQIQSPDRVPATCLRDAATIIESLRIAVVDAARRPMGVVPASAEWLTSDEMDDAELRRTKFLGNGK
jgi:hypothetical protein